MERNKRNVNKNPWNPSNIQMRAGHVDDQRSITMSLLGQDKGEGQARIIHSTRKR